ncbi:MAG TPA: DEAD/DEAH box helicase [Vicinamibacterales bacterium]|nr:DEAD/DEAH box helicase [Vicinamibacterales bacterium]
MPLSSFHPLVARWFTETLGEPTPAQQRGWEAIRNGRHTLIAAPTGSGKTLAAFLTAIDDLVREAATAPLPDEIRVVYVSPLKALSADIHKNLAEPRRGIRQLAEAAGEEAPRITAAVRTGDTTSSERAAILRRPPHILVTTPESLYLLLTAERSRQLLRTVRAVIVDEIHAVIGTRRGAHLALSLERLQHVAERPLLRIGLSATQKPVEDVARFLVGNDEGRGGCAIVDEGHRRTLDLALEIPRSPLSAVMEHEVWEEYYDRLTELIGEHRTTLVFVNTRRMAERVARHLSERLGEHAVTAHHGSLSKETRLDAEHRLKTGALKALVATASLELGIDIGHVDLVCQIGSPHRIATFLQRVGRAGHTVIGTPKGRLFAATRDDLIECAALLRSVRRGELDRIVAHDAPLDVLAQQLTAELACREAGEDELFDFVRRAWPYRATTRGDYDSVIAMLSDGFATRRGRRAALVHRDEVSRVVRARRGSRMLALTSGGAIPEVADYRVILEPEDTFVGTLNEDFAIESSAGDVFQLGNASWQITRVLMGTVRVKDAHGAPPTIPFWLGEAPARSDELSRAVSDLRADADKVFAAAEGTPKGVPYDGVPYDGVPYEAAKGVPYEWFGRETGLDEGATEQAVDYLVEGRNALGVIPTQETLVVERFFDESGGMQLVVHAPFGSRINRAWALALRKRFCRQFNFELQAAATEDALMLSLGPQHSFPLADVFRYLHPASVQEILVQAFLDAPVFATRWRWNTTISLAVPRSRGGSKVAPQLQRMQADDLMAAVFPDAAACLENIPGDRQIPDHPLVAQTVRDCLEEAMDIDGLTTLLDRIHRGELRLISRDTPEPSVFAHEILNARPYAFLDDAPLEERRAHAVQSRRAGGSDGTLATLDPDAIARVVDEARPEWRDADELHDALLTTGFLIADEGTVRSEAFATLSQARRAAVGRVPPKAEAVGGGPGGLLIAAERLPELLAVHPDAILDPQITAPPSRAARTWTRAEAIVELLRGRLAVTGPVTAATLASSLGIPEADADAALLTLEGEGVVLRGNFTSAIRLKPDSTTAAPPFEWCERRLLARIHRYTLNRLRAEIAPVSPAEFMRFLFAWQHVEPGSQLIGAEGMRAVVAQLDGVELPARAWERDVLPARVDRYEPAMLDMLCLTGDVAWARLSSGPTQVVGATPIALYMRAARPTRVQDRDSTYSESASVVFEHLRTRGASFATEIATACGVDEEAVRAALTELVAAGAVSSDGFAGLRTIIGTRPTTATGRWFLVNAGEEPAAEAVAWTLLRRYGVICRRLLARETTSITWRELVHVYRRLEARGEIRGGRFVSGMSGEQYALPDAVERLREIRRTPADDRLVTISAADPLNLTGIVTPGDRLRTVAANRIVYLHGVPVSAMEGDMLRVLAPVEAARAAAVAEAAAGRRVPVVSGYVGRK